MSRSRRQDGEQLVGRRGAVWPRRRLVQATGEGDGYRLAAKGVTPVDEDGRRASEADRLAFVRSAQTVGLKLGEIREIVAFHARGETPCAHVVALLAQHSAELSRRIAELERMKAELTRLARRARSLDPRDCHPSQVCH